MAAAGAASIAINAMARSRPGRAVEHRDANDVVRVVSKLHIEVNFRKRESLRVVAPRDTDSEREEHAFANQSAGTRKLR
jgi:hypothetical protein